MSYIIPTIFFIGLAIAMFMDFREQLYPKRKKRVAPLREPQPAIDLYQIEREIFEESDKLQVPLILYEEYKEYLLTAEWRILRWATFERDNHTCVRCGSTSFLHAHHTHYDGIFDMHFTIDQLETVCTRCHQKIHKGLLPMKKEKQ